MEHGSSDSDGKSDDSSSSPKSIPQQVDDQFISVHSAAMQSFHDTWVELDTEVSELDRVCSDMGGLSDVFSNLPVPDGVEAQAFLVIQEHSLGLLHDCSRSLYADVLYMRELWSRCLEAYDELREMSPNRLSVPIPVNILNTARSYINVMEDNISSLRQVLAICRLRVQSYYTVKETVMRHYFPGGV